jgi:hypothetical protein
MLVSPALETVATNMKNKKSTKDKRIEFELDSKVKNVHNNKPFGLPMLRIVIPNGLFDQSL